MTKNIHILPTDKPSRLALQLDCKPCYNLQLSKIADDWTFNWQKQNLYITSNEEIKEGVDQWYLDKVLNEPYNSGGAQYSSKQDVIILTTDKDLIKDGVQAIDDDFLEWFVKNPSCENVELGNQSIKSFDTGHFEDFYKIIIPKEEPNQIKCYCGHTTYCDCSLLEEPKQETLEEAAENYAIHHFDSSFENVDDHFIAGAKWRQKRSYSEEELLEVVNWYLDEFLDDALGLNGKDAEKKVEHLKSKGLTKEVLKYWSDNFKKK